MDAGKHVEVEIPVADSWADAQAVMAKQRETGLVCMVMPASSTPALSRSSKTSASSFRSVFGAPGTPYPAVAPGTMEASKPATISFVPGGP
jgi:hypothetical protein